MSCRDNKSDLLPVIVNETLKNSEVTKLLKEEHFKLRVSVSTLTDSVIFPCSGIAFLILDFQKELRVYNICKSGDKGRKMFSDIQNRFLASGLQMFPVSSSVECVAVMKTISHVRDDFYFGEKMTHKTNADVIWESLWSTFEFQPTKDLTLRTLASTGVDIRVCGYLLDNLGSLHHVAAADKRELIEASCYDVPATELIINFFRKH